MTTTSWHGVVYPTDGHVSQIKYAAILKGSTTMISVTSGNYYFICEREPGRSYTRASQYVLFMYYSKC